MNQIKIEKYWLSLLNEMAEGNLKKVKSMMTDEGFNSLVKNNPKENYIEIITEYGLLCKQLQVVVNVDEDNKAYLSIGESQPTKGIYPSGVLLKCIDQSLKVIMFYPSK